MDLVPSARAALTRTSLADALSRARPTVRPMTSNKERMTAGDWYITDDEVSALQRERQVLMERYNSISIADPEGRRTLLEELMGSVGPNTEVRSPVYVDYGS